VPQNISLPELFENQQKAIDFGADRPEMTLFSEAVGLEAACLKVGEV
jgi:hypothetical protein